MAFGFLTYNNSAKILIILKKPLKYTTHFLFLLLLPLFISAQTTSDKTDTVNSNAKDTTLLKKNKKTDNKIDAPVFSKAADSTVIDLKNNKMIMVGNANVKYKNIEVSAEYMEFDFGKKEILARPLYDSLGNAIGKPHFKDENDEFDADEIRYNFKTKKGLVKNVRTQEGEGYLISEKTKRLPGNIVCLTHGKFTTCDHEHPHYYIELTKAKVIPNDKIVSGPAYIVLEDVPLPIFIPFGYFPNKKGHSSGVVLPEYGEERNRGFFLKNWGYYFAINDYSDLLLTADIYSLGSWGAHLKSNYKVRYKFNGLLKLDYSKVIISEPDLPDYQNINTYWIRWAHNQDNKANPTMSFKANVNFGSSSYGKYSGVNFNQRLRSTVQSNVAFTKRFANTPFSMSVNLRHSQNMLDSTINLSIPEVAFNMRRIYPFKNKKGGKHHSYEKISVSWSSNMRNTIKVKESDLYKATYLNNYRNGIKHTIPINWNTKLFKYFNLSPSARWTERWYFRSIHKSLIDSTIVTDTVPGFVRGYDYDISIPVNTKIYGFFTFKSKKKNPKIKAIRHMMTPQVGYKYRPDFSESKYGFYEPVPGDTTGALYSIFGDAIFGTPPTGKYGAINFTLNNNVEMKVREGSDTSETYKKIPLLQSLSIASNYNLAVDSMNWSNININARTRLIGMFDLSFSGSVNPYKLDENGKLINELLWNENSIGRFTNGRAAINFNLNDKTFKKKDKKKQNNKNTDGYAYSDIKWNMSISYVYMYSKPYLTETRTQTIRLTGNLKPTDKWRVDFTFGYDLINKKVTYPSFMIYRDLHCWEMSLRIIPFGAYQSYNFTLRVKASMLQDVKYEQRRSWMEYL